MSEGSLKLQLHVSLARLTAFRLNTAPQVLVESVDILQVAIAEIEVGALQVLD